MKLFWNLPERWRNGFLKESGTPDTDRMTYAYRLVLGREPLAAERTRMTAFLGQTAPGVQRRCEGRGELLTRPGMTLDAGSTPAQAAELAAWTSVGRVLLNLDDFMTRD